MKTSDIRLSVQLDENNVPERIDWEAQDNATKSTSKAVLLSIWDEKEKNTLRIDLWTKEMTVEEMKAFFHQNILTLATRSSAQRAKARWRPRCVTSVPISPSTCCRS